MSSMLRRMHRSTKWLVLGLTAGACSGQGEQFVDTSGVEQAIVGVDTYLYFRCNATGWGADPASLLLPTEDPQVFELEYDVDQTWMLNGDNCIFTETNQQNGWGSQQTFYTTPAGASVAAPGGASFAPGSQGFTVTYPALGDYRIRVNTALQSFSIEPAQAPTPVTPSTWTKTDKVLVLNFDPVMGDGQPLSSRTTAPTELAAAYATNMETSSHGAVTYDIVDWQDINAIPQKVDGFSYSLSAYEACLATAPPTGMGEACHVPDLVDYVKIINDYDICGRVESGEIDEVWLFGGSYFGYFESTMAGDGAYTVNSPPVPFSCSKQFLLMGFSYQRGVGEMMEDFGHRLEDLLERAFSTWPTSPTPYDIFSRYDATSPGQAGCGEPHYPPNGVAEYEYDSTAVVNSTCATWDNFPNAPGAPASVECHTWGCDKEGFLSWMFSHVPHNAGTSNGIENDWWKYLIDYNNYHL